MENLNTILPLILILSFQFPAPATCDNRTDLLSLLAFKSSLNDPYGVLNSWNQTLHFCKWRGIRCGRRHPDRVVEINLNSQRLTGPLSPHVGNLSFLRIIDLTNNTFTGPIPQEISLLRRLEVLEVSNNTFTGPVLKNLSLCRNLVKINLVDNELSGTIPMELSFLPKLKVLRLGDNRLSGHIPPSFGNISSLTVLSLKSCGVEGEIPESLTRLQSLDFLQLADNGLTGTIPSALYNMSALQLLSVALNQLHGVIPSTLFLTLPNIKFINLWHNNFSGAIPVSISNASWLQQIDFSDNPFTGPIPRVGRLTHLTVFLFEGGQISDSISFISSLTNSTKLGKLSLGNNLFTGALPDSIANLSTHLYSLHLDRNKIDGKIPPGIGNLINLNILDLHDNNLEGSFPVGITKLSKLQDLFLYRNNITDELPSSLGNLTFLNRLGLHRNNFQGNLPSSIGKCTNLLLLDLSDNGFNGPIPLDIMSLSTLSMGLNLSYNNIEGKIPYEVGSLRNLGALDLSNNRLSGVIPNSLSQCTILETLYLRGNLLHGEIPSALTTLKGLRELDLSRNNLSGSIPTYLEEMNLARLNLSFNRLEGEVPMIGIFKNKTSISLDGNKELCGGIQDLKLPPCSSIRSSKKTSSTLLKILVPIFVAGGICGMLLVYFIYKRRKVQRDKTSYVSPFIGEQFLRLSYADLLRATEGFSASNLVGAGSVGSVYKGILSDRQISIAVKVLNLVVRGAIKSFMAECNVLRGIRHRNLVKILSICDSIDSQGNDFKAIVYEFKANGSLDKWICHSMGQEESGGEARNLNMIQRLNIAIDVAQAIEYLHYGTGSSIVHGDLKPSNILLDHEMTACVGDFGLAKIISNNIMSHESSCSIGIKGTIGYVAPEYAMNNALSVLGDLYSYGILLLEMFTNKRPTDEMFKDDIDLHSFVTNALPDRAMEIMDPDILTGQERISSTKVHDCMVSILSIGVECSRIAPKDRMLMIEVIKEIRKIRAYYLVPDESNLNL